MNEWHYPSGTLARGGFSVRLTPETAHWSHCGLRVVELGPGDGEVLDTEHDEVLVVPLSGGCGIDVAGGHVVLVGREDVFAGPTDVAYLPPGERAVVHSARGARLALATARVRGADESGSESDGASDGVSGSQELAPYPPRRDPAEAAVVELRGAGRCSRQAHGYCLPGRHDAHRLVVRETLTPAGGWSAYPPSKHDEERPGVESALEQATYVEVAGEHGFGFVRVSPSDDRPGEVLAEVRSGDVVLVPHGWFGPLVAAPGHDLYRLDVLAATGERSWRVTEHPDLSDVREGWADEDVDPRLPFGASLAVEAAR